MARKRFKQVGLGSFFGHYVYERVVPRSHFLVRLNEVIDWDIFNEILLPAYKGLAETGRPLCAGCSSEDVGHRLSVWLFGTAG